MPWTRRRLVAATGTVGVGVLAGCSGPADTSGAAPAGGTDAGTPSHGTPSDPPMPTVDRRPHVGHTIDTLASESVNGGVAKDGIPSIDDPVFAGPDTVEVADGAPVFGLIRDGVARAYRQDVLVHHEVVNDVVAGDSVAITYCPLTGTVQGFERGPVEFGVSGNLVNSNLIMYDRATDTRWSQIAKTAVEGPHIGEALREFRLVWTTWGRWRRTHPDTDVLTEETGYARRYDDDPYGTYNPRGGYYGNDRLLFGPISRDDRLPPKAVVIGARTTGGAIAFRKSSLLDRGVVTSHVGETPVVAVAAPALRSGYVYANPDGVTVRQDGEGIDVDGETHDPEALPLERIVAFDAMWFAWYGFYPETNYVE